MQPGILPVVSNTTINGSVIELDYYDSAGNLKSRWSDIFKYDETGNWIEDISYDDGMVKSILVRKIEYY